MTRLWWWLRDWLATYELWRDPELRARIREAEAEVASGRGVPWEQVQRDLPAG